MKKPWKFMFGTLVVLFLIYLWLKSYTDSVVDMESKVGSRVGGGELTMSEYYTLKSYMELYRKNISEGKYDTSYRMLGITYREYIPYEKYIENLEKENINEFIIEDINIITDTTYDLILDNSGDKIHYSIIVDDSSNGSVIYPASFLDYKNINKKINKNKVEIVLKDYVVNKIILNLSMNNNSNKKINFFNSKLITNGQGKIESDQNIELNAKESKDITIEYSTNYEFPSQVTLYGNIEGKDKSVDYVIDIK